MLGSHVPLVIIESREENRAMQMLRKASLRANRPLYLWSITEGLGRADYEGPAQRQTADPGDALRHIKTLTTPSVFAMADFHPYLEDPVNTRLLKEIALAHGQLGHKLVLLSHALDVPQELRPFTARFELTMPDRDALERMVHDIATAWSRNRGQRVRTDRKTLDKLITNLAGLSRADAERLAKGAIQDDGAITEDDLPQVMEAKYELLDRTGALSFEYETARFSDVGGLNRLKQWLRRRREVFLAPDPALEPPKGILLVGVQGAGKSLAAKAVAGLWQLPLLRLDVGTLYNKYFGESERNLREAIQTAELMAPCVLWIDEIEKAMAEGENDGGVSRRMLGTLLTWMAEKRKPVFLVATANAIERLPPELIRKGRMDEIFFVDLPSADVRGEIFAIHLERRGVEAEDFNLEGLADAAEGFSGAEIEQAVVAALYLARERKQPLDETHVLEELRATSPLSVVMAEKIQALREWARSRSVPAD
ncbi:AAA family ATPase [Ectothiorhodospiraceae bacterium WFHF3C12]|nr:AAA family ATPase [Ectothiorhodospiraceae bacterium WFHF3C12]